MTDKKTQALAEHSNMEKDPADWVTGDEPMTGAQRSYLKTLSEQTNEPFDESLSKAEASRRIDAMTDKKTQSPDEQSNTEKDPADWVTGDEPMTGAQRSYLKTLSEEAKEPFDDSLSKAEASRRIDELQARTGRGSGNA
ncbi:MAG: hypothetical protein JWR68_730 [Polaromonas sp.]|nr:hypothetical protein [Polaromonas sp.]